MHIIALRELHGIVYAPRSDCENMFGVCWARASARAPNTMNIEMPLGAIFAHILLGKRKRVGLTSFVLHLKYRRIFTIHYSF